MFGILYAHLFIFVSSFLSQDSKEPPDCCHSESFTSPSCFLGVDLRRGRRRFSGNLQLPPLSWRQGDRSRTPDEEIMARPTSLPFGAPPRIDITPVDPEWWVENDTSSQDAEKLSIFCFDFTRSSSSEFGSRKMTRFTSFVLHYKHPGFIMLKCILFLLLKSAGAVPHCGLFSVFKAKRSLFRNLKTKDINATLQPLLCHYGRMLHWHLKAEMNLQVNIFLTGLTSLSCLGFFFKVMLV